jgi:hypothetical protein
MTNWVSKIDHHHAWETMMWFAFGKRPFRTSTLRGACNTEAEFRAYGFLEKLNEHNRQDGPIPSC